MLTNIKQISHKTYILQYLQLQRHCTNRIIRSYFSLIYIGLFFSEIEQTL